MKSEAKNGNASESNTELTATWIALLVFSVASYLLADLHLTGVAFVAIVLVAVWIKFGLVLTVFMELGHRGRSWLLPILLFLGLGLVAFGLLLV